MPFAQFACVAASIPDLSMIPVDLGQSQRIAIRPGLNSPRVSRSFRLHLFISGHISDDCR